MKMKTYACWLLHVHTDHVSCLARAPVVETVLVRMTVKDVITVHNYSTALSLEITSYQLTKHYLSVLLPQSFSCVFFWCCCCCCLGGGNDFKAFNNVRDILYNTDAITSVVKLIVHRLMDIYIKEKRN